MGNGALPPSKHRSSEIDQFCRESCHSRSMSERRILVAGCRESCRSAPGDRKLAPERRQRVVPPLKRYTYGRQGHRRSVMGLSEFDPAARERVSWNAGRKVGAKRALKPRQIWAISSFLDQHGRVRDRALFGLAIDSRLRGCDLVKIRISDIVCDRKIRTRATVVQQKTGRPVQFELMTDARASLLKWLELRGGSEEFAFPSRTDHAAHISIRQYARLVDEWVTGVGLPSEDYGTHSLRRTKASIIYKATGNLRAVQILLGHTRIASTVRYLGVDVEDALTLA